MAPAPSGQDRRRLITTIAVIGMALTVMITLVSFSVPLYRAFCAATGAGGTTRRVAADTAQVTGRVVTVFFNTDVSPSLPWSFRPLQRSVRVHLGEQAMAWFAATNNSDTPIVGHATYNVTPDKVGIFFRKIQCFCFTEERLAPHQTVQMPVQFYVDPGLATQADTTDVDQITLSYTFFRSARPARAQDLARLASAPPSAARGADLFAARCSACHALDQPRVGPPLRNVVGRQAGTAHGYDYSAALAHSRITWTATALNGWLSDPQAYVKGSLMPVSVRDASTRRDIVAYLESVSPPPGAGL